MLIYYILRVLYSLLYFIMIFILLVYLFTNIKLIDESSQALILLVVSTIIGLFLIITRFLLQQRLLIKRSFFFLVLFLTYFIFKIIIDIGTEADLKAFTIATSSGIILYYIIGALISLNFLYIKDTMVKSSQFTKYFYFLFFIFVLIFSYLLMDTFLALKLDLQTDAFLISNFGNYQRPGAFLTMCFLLYSYLFSFVIIFSINIYCLKKIFLFFMFIIYIFNIICGLLLSQMIGSNNTFINLLGILIGTILFYIFLYFESSRKLLSNMKLSFRMIFFGALKKNILLSILISFILIPTLLVVVLYFSEMDLNKLRIFGFGSGDISSVSSRIELLKNFPIHFNYNPIFGNMAVDTYTTGTGSYIHSLIGSLLTHLGILGFLLFLIFLFVAIKEKFSSKDNLYLNNAHLLYVLILFGNMFIIASVGVFFTWGPIWFLFGLVFPPFVFRRRQV